MKDVRRKKLGSPKSALAVFQASSETWLQGRRYRMKMGQTLLLGLSLVSVLAAGASAADMGTAFTYQGFLEDGGGPVTNTAPGCDFEFELWDALADGTQIAGTQAVNGVSVDGGVFTVVLDFGSGAFNGQARWLNIKVCCPTSCATAKRSGDRRNRRESRGPSIKHRARRFGERVREVWPSPSPLLLALVSVHSCQAMTPRAFATDSRFARRYP